MKRFWDHAVAVARPEGGHAVLLDGRPLRLPGGAPLATRSAPLAAAIAGEWQAAGARRGGEMTMEQVPLTRLLGTAQERVAADPAAMVEGLARYAETDLLCYRGEDASLAALRAAVAAHAAEELAALGVAVPALGSLVLGLALSAGRVAAAEAHRLAVLDETFQEQRWGVDEAVLARRARLAADVALAERFLALLRA